MEDSDLARLLREGISAARAGQKDRAREVLLQVIAQDEGVEAAWLWLSGVVDDPEERQICLENALTLNPNNIAAQKGLRWLRGQGQVSPPQPSAIPSAHPEKAPRPVLRVVPGESSPVARSGVETVDPPGLALASPVAVEIDPHGCPYCGGSVSGAELRCDHCRRSMILRYRKREEVPGPGWLVVLFLLLGLSAWLEGYMVAQVSQMGQLPHWLSYTFVKLMVGSALFSPEGVGDLVQLAGVVTWVNYVLAGLCVLVAVGLALRSRIVYFGSFLPVGLMVIVTGVGLLTKLVGWLPAIFRLGLAAFTLKWLMDSAPAFEWQTRCTNADTDQDLRTDLDYHNRGRHYYKEGMWAKAAAHWKVATQLAPGQVRYRAELANAYLKMGYPGAALAEVEKALSRGPDDKALRAFRDSLADLEGKG
jgi:tetratricopeptide (TPR) repeat protein